MLTTNQFVVGFVVSGLWSQPQTLCGRLWLAILQGQESDASRAVARLTSSRLGLWSRRDHKLILNPQRVSTSHLWSLTPHPVKGGGDHKGDNHKPRLTTNPGETDPMTERELTPGDVQDARAIAAKLRGSGYLRVQSMDAARTIERLADAYEQRVARHEALVAALAVDHGAEPQEQGGGL